MVNPNIITISPDVHSGTPVFSGTRVPVKVFFDYLNGNDTVAEFLHDFPSVSPKQVEHFLMMLESFATQNTGSINNKSAA